MNKQQHVVFGAGLIGSFLAGGLLAAEQRTAIVARDKTRQEMKSGLVISDYLGHQRPLPMPQFVDREPLTADVLWLTVKCTGVADAVNDMRPLIGPESLIICCQNGLGSDHLVRQQFANNRVIKAVVGYNVVAPGPGHWHRSTEGKLVIEDRPDAKIKALAEALDSGLFPTVVSTNFTADQWAKLQLNLANAVNALSDVPIKAMLEQRDFRVVIAELMRELLEVSDALRLSLPRLTALPPHWIPRLLDVPDWLFRLLGQKMLAIDPTARASMWWDLDAGKPTEIAFLNAALVEQGTKLGIPCPVNQAVSNLVARVETGAASIGFSAQDLKNRVIR